MSHLRWDKKWQNSTSSFVSHLSLSLQKWTEPDMYCMVNRWKMNKIIKILIQYIFKMKKINQVFCIEAYASLCFPHLRTSTTHSQGIRGGGAQWALDTCVCITFSKYTHDPACAQLSQTKKIQASDVRIISGLLSDLVCHWIRSSGHIMYQGKGYPSDFYYWLQTSSSRIFKIMIL